MMVMINFIVIKIIQNNNPLKEEKLAPTTSKVYSDLDANVFAYALKRLEKLNAINSDSKSNIDYELGVMYATGDGVLNKNYEEARKWFARAAAQGDEIAKKKFDKLQSPEFNETYGLSDLDQQPVPIGTRSLPQPPLGVIQKEGGGSVIVDFIIDENGDVSWADSAMFSDPVMLDIALGGVKNWKFKPGKKNDKAVKVLIKHKIWFWSEFIDNRFTIKWSIDFDGDPTPPK